MLFLCIETSGRRGGLALWSGSTCRREVQFTEGLVHGREIALRLSELLQGLGLVPAALDGIAVSLGPGSFTGLRVGVVAAKTLAFALRIPVVTASSLKIIAGNALNVQGSSSGSEPAGLGRVPTDGPLRVLSVLDARQGAYFAAAFEVCPGRAGPQHQQIVQRLPDGAYRPEEILHSLGESGAEESCNAAVVLVVGEGADALLESLAATGSSFASGAVLRRGPREWDLPRASVLGSLTAPTIPDAEFEPESIHALEPAYLRLSDAERRFLSRKKV